MRITSPTLSHTVPSSADRRRVAEAFRAIMCDLGIKDGETPECDSGQWWSATFQGGYPGRGRLADVAGMRGYDVAENVEWPSPGRWTATFLYSPSTSVVATLNDLPSFQRAKIASDLIDKLGCILSHAREQLMADEPMAYATLEWLCDGADPEDLDAEAWEPLWEDIHNGAHRIPERICTTVDGPEGPYIRESVVNALDREGTPCVFVRWRSTEYDQLARAIYFHARCDVAPSEREGDLTYVFVPHCGRVGGAE